MFEWSVVILSIISVMLIPLVGLLIHLTIKWTRAEARQEEMAKDIKDLVDSKEKVHSELYKQMTSDRQSADRRLRWLEENLWKSGGRLPRSRS